MIGVGSGVWWCMVVTAVVYGGYSGIYARLCSGIKSPKSLQKFCYFFLKDILL